MATSRRTGESRGRGNKGASPARIERIKARIARGQFKVEPKKVADRMIEDALREIRARKRPS